jgi:hypothetical protein
MSKYIDESGNIDADEFAKIKLPPQVKGKLEYHSTPNTESDKSIDECLKGKVRVVAQENTDCYVDPTCKAVFDAPKLKSELYSLLMDVIGEDETNGQIESRTIKELLPMRNKLRAEQRQKLNKLFGKEK